MKDETLFDKATLNYNAALVLRKATEDDEAYLNLIGYHLQQAVELCLKYQLECFGIEYPKTHDIDQLIQVAKEKEGNLIVTDYIYDHSDTLTMWEAKTRYVLGYRVELRKIDKAIDGVKVFLETVKDQMREKSEGIANSSPSVKKKPYRGR